jgi:hypothetical protein
MLVLVEIQKILNEDFMENFLKLTFNNTKTFVLSFLKRKRTVNVFGLFVPKR